MHVSSFVKFGGLYMSCASLMLGQPNSHLVTNKNHYICSYNGNHDD